MKRRVSKDKNESTVIRSRFEKLSECDKGMRKSSSVSHKFGFPWYMDIEKDSDGIHVWLNIQKEESSVWYCDASAEFSMINQEKDGVADLKFKSCDHRVMFWNDSIHTGIYSRLRLKANLSPGFLKNDSIVIESRIFVHSLEGSVFRKRMRFDMYSPSEISDGILIVEGKKIYVSKQLLAIHSEFFKKLFYGSFEESNADKVKEVKLEDISLSDFTIILKQVYPTGEEIREDNVHAVLKMADRFEMMNMLDKAEKFLLSFKTESERTKEIADRRSPSYDEDSDRGDDEDRNGKKNNLNLHARLRLADQYNLHTLKRRCLNQYTPPRVRKMQRSFAADYEALSDATKLQLLQEYVDMTTPKRFKFP